MSNYEEPLKKRYVSLLPLNRVPRTHLPRGLGAISSGNIFFKVRPVISESRNVGYSNEGLPMTASGLVIYAATESRVFSLTGKFISRTIEEAKESWYLIQLIKSYSIPEYISATMGEDDFNVSSKAKTKTAKQNEDLKDTNGVNTSAQDALNLASVSPSEIFSGAGFNLNQYGPTVLKLSGYDTFNEIPCVIQNYNIEYPDDVDYINFETDSGMRSVPIFQTVSVTLLETHLHELLDDSGKINNVNNLFNFDMKAYRNGNLEGY